MFQSIKRLLYFPVASYFRFFAKIKLARWNPRIIVITGSSGKTTLLHLVESELGDEAKYSHHANSSYGIPFDILGLERTTLMLYEWLELFLKAPFLTFSQIPRQKTYVVETDCDRPGEGKFLATLLRPEVTIWLSLSRTHSMNFESLVVQKKFETVEESIAFEYGFFLEYTSKLVIINSDTLHIRSQSKRTKSEEVYVSKKPLTSYNVSKNGTVFKIKGESYSFKFLLPVAVSASISATLALMKYLGKSVSGKFKKFKLPPGRSSVFEGIRDTTLIDSSYNTGLAAMTEIINMFNNIDATHKWLVIGDILEQGKWEQEEHERLADLIVKSNYDRIVLLGPRIVKYGYPIIKKRYQDKVVSFTSPKDVLDYLKQNIKGGETILFKGARFLEGVIENLLANPDEAKKLARREKIWEIRRKKWGL